MRINCDIQINNRQLSTLNLAGKKSTRCSLAIGKQPGEVKNASNLFIHVCSLQNKQGNKYKIWNNIQAVFTKFLSEGKFTIQLKEPSIDLFVKAEPSLAKGFLKLLKLSLENKNLDKLPFSHLNPVKQNQIEKPKTKLIILDRKDYPTTIGFPSSLETLTISGVKLNRIEKRITNLKRLYNLDLSDNQIAEIPNELGLMASLTVLNLTGNKIAIFPHHFFNSSVKDTLVNLNLSNNEIQVMPWSIIKLKRLDTLILSHNKLTRIPLHIDRLVKLKHLDLSHNSLEEVPASILNLYLESINVSNNPLPINLKIIENRLESSVLSLKDIAAAVCIQERLEVHPRNVPFILCDYLDGYLTCLCSKILFFKYLLATILINLCRFPSATVTNSNCVPALGTFCSLKCWKRFGRSRLC